MNILSGIPFKTSAECCQALRDLIASSEWTYPKVAIEVDIEYTRLWRTCVIDAKMYFDEVVRISEFLAKVNNGREESGQRVLSSTEGE